jgi:protein disulfide-isomerase
LKAPARKITIARVKTALPILLLAAISPAFAVSVGDTYASVVGEKGQPVGVMTAGSVSILTYPDLVIKLRDNTVVSFRAPGRAPAVAAAPAASAATGARPSGEAYDGPAVWETDFGAALDQAKARKCHILVLYTGSDWCPWCKKMDEEVYSQPEFARYSHEKFVLLKLDHLRHSPLSDAAKAQNDDMLERYHVKGYPNAVIVDMYGNALGRFTGYYQGGPSRFIHMIQALE